MVSRAFRQGFQVQLQIAGNYREAYAVAVAFHYERLEDLFDRHPDLARDGLRAEIAGIDLIFARFVGNARAFKKADCIGFGQA